MAKRGIPRKEDGFKNQTPYVESYARSKWIKAQPDTVNREKVIEKRDRMDPSKKTPNKKLEENRGTFQYELQSRKTIEDAFKDVQKKNNGLTEIQKEKRTHVHDGVYRLAPGEKPGEKHILKMPGKPGKRKMKW